MTSPVLRAFDYEGAPFVIVCPHDDDLVAQAIARSGSFYERDVLEAIRATVDRRTPFVAVDVGANVGNHTVYFARCLSAVCVIACEPFAATFAILRATLAANHIENVRACQIAVAEADGVGSMIVPNAAQLGWNELRDDPSAGERVEVRRLDALIGETVGAGQRIGLIKVDAERTEARILRGAGATIATHRPVLCLELHTTVDMREALALLPGYVVRQWTGSTPTFLLTASPRPQWLVNAVNRLWIRTLATQRRSWAWKLSRLTTLLAA